MSRPSSPRAESLTGVARLAAESPRLRERAEVEFFALPARSILNRAHGERLPFAWTINPYRGCEFGCKYCYARYTHEFMELRDGLDFERKIYAKTGAPELLRTELRRVRDGGLPIALGTATDPYQPGEKRLEVTRRLLQVFLEFDGIPLSITTKSTLILRDLDLLKAISAKHDLSVHITVTTVNSPLARKLEPKAPPPSRRLAAIAALVRGGIYAGVNAMPILPGITDSAIDLTELARQSAEAGARFFHGNALFLMPSAMRQFMPFLRNDFPQLAGRYEMMYGRSAYASESYRKELAERFADLRDRYGLNHARPARPPAKGSQLMLCYA